MRQNAECSARNTAAASTVVAGGLLSKAGDVARQATTRLLHEIIPRTCVFCGDIGTYDGGAVCAACFDDLPWLENPCPTCAMPLGIALADGQCCGACQTRPPPFARAVVALDYRFPIDAAIRRFKFHGRLQYAPAFAEVLLHVSGSLPPDVDALLPVPLHRWRQVRRGFNQATELAVPVSRALGLPLVANVRRRIATPYQSGLDAASRRRNLKSAFAVRGTLRARHVVIVDDVVTTGETCRQLANCLAKAGVGNVSVLALARAV